MNVGSRQGTERTPRAHAAALAIDDGWELPAAHTYELIGAVYRESDAFVADFAEMYPTSAVLAAELDDLRRRPGSLCLVARRDDDAVGFLLIEPRRARRLRHTADLRMGVRAAERGHGVGGALLEAALRRLRSDAVIEIVYLMVRADNVAARGLYAGHGFETLATLSRDTKVGDLYFDGVLMRAFVVEVRP